VCKADCQTWCCAAPQQLQAWGAAGALFDMHSECTHVGGVKVVSLAVPHQQNSTAGRCCKTEAQLCASSGWVVVEV
jgi:hypothetical protein